MRRWERCNRISSAGYIPGEDIRPSQTWTAEACGTEKGPAEAEGSSNHLMQIQWGRLQKNNHEKNKWENVCLIHVSSLLKLDSLNPGCCRQKKTFNIVLLLPWGLSFMNNDASTSNKPVVWMWQLDHNILFTYRQLSSFNHQRLYIHKGCSCI